MPSKTMATLPPTSEPDQTRHEEGPCEAGPDVDGLLATLDEQAAATVEITPSKLDFRLIGVDDRERALPVRQGDLTRLLLAEPGLSAVEREKLAHLGRLLGAVFHSEFHDTLREMKELYAPLDPDSDYVTLKNHTRPVTEDCDEAFLAPFEQTLLQANYRPLALTVIKEAVSAPNEMGLTYVPDFSLFDHMRVYVRGYTQICRECRNVRTRFRKQTVTLDAYQRMVVVLKFKDGLNLGPLVRSDVLYLRMFKDVPHVDMEMHLPEQGTKVRMRWVDKAQIASPLAVGIPTLIAKVLFLGLVSRVALAGMLIAPISAGVNSFFGFHRSKQKHLYSMIYRLYYLTLANNASVLTRLIDSAEDEEYKEAMLAYFFLWRGNDEHTPWEVAPLDDHIEHYLRVKTGVMINFEVADALGKLLRLGLAHRDHLGRVHATPLDQALQTLDRRWDDTFRFT
jgi:hypothetical protein